jgi:hypothetical protein
MRIAAALAKSVAVEHSIFLSRPPGEKGRKKYCVVYSRIPAL